MAELKVVGLRELRNGLRKADALYPKALQKLNKSISAELVPEARARLAQHSPRAGSRAIGTIRGLATQTSATIAGGGASVPWYGGHEWGSLGNIRGNSRLGNKGHTRMFPTRNPEGYGIYPTVQRNLPRIVEKYTKLLGELTKEAFPG